MSEKTGKIGLVLLGAGLAVVAWLIWQGQKQEALPADQPEALAQPWRDESGPRAIRDLLDAQAEAWNRGDLEGYMDGYLRSPSLTFSSGNEPRRGWDETLARYRKNYQGKGKKMGRLTFSDIDVRMMRGDLALVTGRWKLRGLEERPDGLFTLVVWHGPDGWRIVHDHTSAGQRDLARDRKGR